MVVLVLPNKVNVLSCEIDKGLSVTYGRYVLTFRDNPKRRLKGFLYLER